MRAGRVFVLIVLAFLPAAETQGAPPPLTTQIRLVGPAEGFVAVAEVVTPQGAVIDTFRSGDMTLKVIGSPGSTVKVRRAAEGAAGREGVAIALSTSRPKRLQDATTYARSGRTVVGDLVALGMPEDEARRQFGDMEVLDPEAAARTREMASTVTDPGILAAAFAARTSTTVPYDTQCASVSYQGGLIEGYGCSTLYLVAASGGDWWFNNKYRFSARSKDPTNWFCFPGTCPWRLFRMGWSLGWSSNNVLHEWDPGSTETISGCSSLSFSASYHGFGLSIGGTVCPEKLQPWNVGARSSGAEWLGLEQGTAWETAFGMQGIHSPPAAAASYSSPFTMTWARWNT